MKLNRKEDDRRLHVYPGEGSEYCYLRLAERIKNNVGAREHRWVVESIDLSRDELEKLIKWAQEFLKEGQP